MAFDVTTSKIRVFRGEDNFKSFLHLGIVCTQWATGHQLQIAWVVCVCQKHSGLLPAKAGTGITSW